MRKTGWLLGLMLLVTACSQSGTPLTPIGPRPGATAHASPSATGTPVATPAPTATAHANATGTPVPNVTASPTAVPTASGPAATPTAIPSGLMGDALSVAVASKSLQDTEVFYKTLPHTNPNADIAAVAAHMVSSGEYTAAAVSPGGITGTLPDGSMALVFADAPEDLGLTAPTTSAVARRSAAQIRNLTPNPISAPTQNEIAFLTTLDDSTTFSPLTDKAYLNAFSNLGFAKAGYGLDAQQITLDNISALGTGHPIDFLNISAHGMISVQQNSTYAFWFDSDSPADAPTKAAYQPDFMAHNITYAYYLNTDPNAPIISATFAFSPAFLTSHLHFNSGAVLNFGSCWSANPLILPQSTATFQAAGVGRFYGWTKATVAVDYYESLAFLLDRMLGEQSPTVTGLDTYATQRVPSQRPFSLDNVYGIMQTETRAGPLHAAQNEPYTTSDKGATVQSINVGQPPIADLSASKMIQTDFNLENQAGAPIVYGLPSITNISIAEDPANPVMTINGAFPPDQGTVAITDGSGTTQLTVSSWTQTQIQTSIPVSGNGSSGLVVVSSKLGVPGNAVPITQWTGQFTYNESDQIASLGTSTGSGSGTMQIQFDTTFRSDVHSIVPTIDASPQPQNFVFSFTEGNSTAQLTDYSGSFVSDDKVPKTASFSAISPAPNAVAATPPLGEGTFELRSWEQQPAPCNSGDPLTSSPGGNTFCPLMGFIATDAQISCTEDDAAGSLCGSPDISNGVVSYGGPFDAEGILSLTLDPATYAIGVTGTKSQFYSNQFYASGNAATGSMTGSVGAPIYSPTSATTDVRTRRARK